MAEIRPKNFGKIEDQLWIELGEILKNSLIDIQRFFIEEEVENKTVKPASKRKLASAQKS